MNLNLQLQDLMEDMKEQFREAMTFTGSARNAAIADIIAGAGITAKNDEDLMLMIILIQLTWAAGWALGQEEMSKRSES